MSSEDIVYKPFHAPFDAKERELWQQFLKEKVQLPDENLETETLELDERWTPIWNKYRDTWLIPRTPTTPKGLEEDESSDTDEPEPDQKGKGTMASTSGTTVTLSLDEEGYEESS
jgi:hypothetical protein